MTPQPPFVIPGSSSSTLGLDFSPTTLGLRLCGLLIHSDAAPGAPALVQVRGTGDEASDLRVSVFTTDAPGLVGEQFEVSLEVENNTNRTEPFLLTVVLVAADSQIATVYGPRSVHLGAGGNSFQTGIAPLEASMVGINILVAYVGPPGQLPTDMTFHSFEVRP